MASTWFITGASRGFGRELTEQALTRGDRVAATARRPEQLDDLVAAHGDRLWVRKLDVTDTEQVHGVVDAAFADLGRIDVVVSNAGFGVFGTAEEHTDEQIDGIVATNLTGPIHRVQAVTPHLREQGGGRILQMSSMGGIITFPGFSSYHATKFGIEGFFDAYAPEVAPFGIRTTLIEPGMIRTSFYEAAQHAPRNPAYDSNPALHREGIPMEQMPGDQAKVVAAMIDVADMDNPPQHLLLGSDAYNWVRAALSERLAAVEAQKDVAYSTDIDGFPHVES